MNAQLPITKSPEIITPIIDTERINQLASSADPQKAAAAYASGAFASANIGIEAAKAQVENATARVTIKKAQLHRAEARQNTMSPTSSWAGTEIIAPMSLTQRTLNMIGIVFVVIDPLMTMYATGSYLASSGLIENMADSIWQTLPFCFIFPLAIMGLKALHDCLPSEKARHYFRLGLLVTGALAFCAFAVCYARSFNPASAALPNAGNPGAEGGRLSLLFAAMLVLLQVIATVASGAGITLMLVRSLDKNKVVNSAPCHDFVVTSGEVHELEIKCEELLSIISASNDYISNYNSARDGFISMVASRVVGTRDFIDANAQLARHKIQRRLANGSDPNVEM